MSRFGSRHGESLLEIRFGLYPEVSVLEQVRIPGWSFPLFVILNGVELKCWSSHLWDAVLLYASIMWNLGADPAVGSSVRISKLVPSLVHPENWQLCPQEDQLTGWSPLGSGPCCSRSSWRSAPLTCRTWWACSGWRRHPELLWSTV